MGSTTATPGAAGTEDLLTLDAGPHPDVELLDLGCGSGRGLENACRRFAAKGVGLELNPVRVREAQERGLPVYRLDIRQLDVAAFPGVKYVTLDNVLEHLHTLDDVESVLARSCEVARRVVHVRHPSFEHEEYLASLGLKQYWTDWGGHRSHVRLHEFAAMAAHFGVYRYSVIPVKRAHDSNDPTILPLNAPKNQYAEHARYDVYDPELHDEKPFVEFTKPVYYAFDLFFIVGDEDPIISYAADTEFSPARPDISFAADRSPAADGDGDRDPVTHPAPAPHPVADADAAPDPELEPTGVSPATARPDGARPAVLRATKTLLRRIDHEDTLLRRLRRIRARG